MAASSVQLGDLASQFHNSKVSILIADDSRMGCQLLEHALCRSRFRFEIAGSAISRTEILASLRAKPVDVALINQSLQDGQLVGFELLNELRESFPQTRAVLLLKTASYELVVDAFRGGAKGVFCRTESFEALCKCIHSVHKGQVWANSDQLHYLLEALVQTKPLRVVDFSGRPLLTKREQEVAFLLADGLPNKQIAHKLKLSEHTVSNYLFRIYNKLGVSSRVELVLYLLKQKQQS
ncbi:MAG: LuxR C-terminal-related transcriptional regulator [Candidatus Dormibacteria bacterium]